MNGLDPSNDALQRQQQFLSILERLDAYGNRDVAGVVRAWALGELGFGLSGRDIGALLGRNAKHCADRMRAAGHTPVSNARPMRWSLDDVLSEFSSDADGDGADA